MITHLEVPDYLHRNAVEVAEAGYENTGQILIDIVTRRVGLDSLADVDVLDVGCGVRFTQTLINRRIPIKSYSGLEVYKPIVDFLQEHVQAHDDRFRFAYWNVRNQMYNPDGTHMAEMSALPFHQRFDLIWLFSVFTHLDPSDSKALLALLRKHIRPEGKLFFSAFIDDQLEGFEDRVPDQPLLNAYYGPGYLRSLVEAAGWKVERLHPADYSRFIHDHLVCSPA